MANATNRSNWIVRVLALVGICAVAAAFIAPLWLKHQRVAKIAELRRKVPWPAVYRDCLTANSERLSDTQHLKRAELDWIARLEDNTSAYRQQFVEHPLDLSRSRVRRFPTPSTSESQLKVDMAPYEYATHISAVDAAKLGLRAYVIVELATPGGVETEHSFRYDLCGNKF